MMSSQNARRKKTVIVRTLTGDTVGVPVHVVDSMRDAVLVGIYKNRRGEIIGSVAEPLSDLDAALKKLISADVKSHHCGG